MHNAKRIKTKPIVFLNEKGKERRKFCWVPGPEYPGNYSKKDYELRVKANKTAEDNQGKKKR